MKFKLDENLPEEAAVLLRYAGHDAHTVREEHLTGSPDSRVAAVSRAEERIRLTCDMDFSNILQYPPTDYPGIVVLRLARQDRDSILAIIPRILELLQTESVRERLWIVDERRTRIRG
jgi:predicted nuclease of predicted toxin-antitoxin system